MVQHKTALQVGLAHHRAGRIEDAEDTYRRVLAADPRNPDALHLLGLIEMARGNQEMARDLVRKAIKASPKIAIYHNSLGEILRKLGKYEDALAAFRRAIRIDKAYPEPLNNLGLLLREQGRLRDGIARLRQAIKLRPDYAEAHSNLGVALYDAGEFADAVSAYERAIACNPGLTSAFNNMGNALRRLGRLDEAIAAFQTSIGQAPDYAEAYSNLGVVYHQQRRLDEAENSFRRAIALKPELPDAHNNLAMVLRDRDRLDEAHDEIRRAIALKPDYAEAHNNLGDILLRSNRLNSALESFETALSIDPDLDKAYFSLVCHLPLIADWERANRYFGDLPRRMNAALDDGGEEALASLIPLSFTLPYFSGDDALDRAACRGVARYVTLQREKLAPGIVFDHPKRAPRLKVGYVSPDFGDHPISHVTRPVYALHDRGDFEVYCYSLLDRGDHGGDYLADIRAAADHFVDLSRSSFLEGARRINDDGIHILVDLSGYMRFGWPQLFAMRPAPVQVYWLGHGGSLCAPYMDYIIGDRWVTPPEVEPDYTEKIVRLPDSFSSAERAPISSAPQARADYGLPEDGVVFAGFNNSLKIEPTAFESWMRILDAVPGSVLWLAGGRDAVLSERLARAARALGVDPARLIFAERLPDKAVHLARHRLADLFLDTFKFNASTTALDALWAGLPIVTLAGGNFYSRIGASYLSAVGLDELITDSAPDYERLAIELASDADKRREIKARLVANRLGYPLFDSRRFVRHIEAAYRRMWAIAEAGGAPQSFDLPAAAD